MPPPSFWIVNLIHNFLISFSPCFQPHLCPNPCPILHPWNLLPVSLKVSFFSCILGIIMQPNSCLRIMWYLDILSLNYRQILSSNCLLMSLPLFILFKVQLRYRELSWKGGPLAPLHYVHTSTVILAKFYDILTIISEHLERVHYEWAMCSSSLCFQWLKHSRVSKYSPTKWLKKCSRKCDCSWMS